MSRAARVAGPIAGSLLLAIAASSSVTRLSAQPTSAPSSSAAPKILVQLPTASSVDRQRVESAAREAVNRYTEWLGPFREPAIAIWDQRREPIDELAQANVFVDVPFWSAPATMDLESQAAFAIARHWFLALSGGNDAVPLQDGIAWYLQSRVIERLFDFSFHVPGHSATGVRTFGGALPWTFGILPLDVSSGGLAREEYLRSLPAGTQWPQPARRLPPHLTPLALRIALAFGTLERMVGWPALQGGLRVLSSSADRGRPITRQEAEQILASALGQDLSWFFDTVFDPSQRIDYEVASLTTGEPSSCGDRSCVRTRVIVTRRGAGQFTGRAADESSRFDAGDAMALLVTFADGQRATERWDGRAVSREFSFDSAAPAVSAEIDPDRLLLLDENRINNRVGRDGHTTVAVGKWIAYWMAWLEGAVLDYGALF